MAGPARVGRGPRSPGLAWPGWPGECAGWAARRPPDPSSRRVSCCAWWSRWPSRQDNRRMTVRIMIAEDQTMVRQALVALLELEPDIEVIAQAADGNEAVAMARKHQPEVAVLDIEMPGLTGIEVAGELKRG